MKRLEITSSNINDEISSHMDKLEWLADEKIKANKHLSIGVSIDRCSEIDCADIDRLFNDYKASGITSAHEVLGLIKLHAREKEQDKCSIYPDGIFPKVLSIELISNEITPEEYTDNFSFSEEANSFTFERCLKVNDALMRESLTFSNLKLINIKSVKNRLALLDEASLKVLARLTQLLELNERFKVGADIGTITLELE